MLAIAFSIEFLYKQLFFLSKFGCLIEKIKFYSNSTINSMWDEIDVLLTANPDLLLNIPNESFITGNLLH